ncbi:MAG: 6-carboxytetrahydropterin synthase [Bacteroidota bacterium]|nr:6-carboxytetrahydropterin synthase [Bacteroidota bacterium]
MIYVTRRSHFSASHRLFNPKFSDEKNVDMFDKCANPNGHGHNYYLEVCIAGEPNRETGYVIDLKKLKRIINEQFVDKVDHKNLNVDVDFLSGINPTAENIVIAAWKQIVPHITEGTLHSIRLHETENNFVEYRGE